MRCNGGRRGNAIQTTCVPSHLPDQDYATNTAQLDFPPLTAVHVANYFYEEDQKSQFGCAETTLDQEYLRNVGLLEHVEGWWKECNDDEVFLRR